MWEVGEVPLEGGTTTGLAAEEVLFLLRPNGKDLNREFMRSMCGKRRGRWEREDKEERRERARATLGGEGREEAEYEKRRCGDQGGEE